jgi:hypothetical protein
MFNVDKKAMDIRDADMRGAKVEPDKIIEYKKRGAIL